MERFGQVIGLKPERYAEYVAAHAAVWPGVLAKIRECNIRNYSIFAFGEDRLFAYFEYVGDDFEGRYPVRDRSVRPLWHRRFLLRPDRDDWMIWQLHGYANVAGISGGADLNVMRSSPLTP